LPVSETWGQALVATIRSYFKNFWYITRVALPLMLLAAFLGAFVIEVLPPQALFVPVSLLGIIAVAIVSSFLPVPMAFDVAIAYILMAKGVPLPYCVTILCTLGIVSVFSLSIVGKPYPGKSPARPTPLLYPSAPQPAFSPKFSFNFWRAVDCGNLTRDERTAIVVVRGGAAW
jgi:hypothetical protein